MTVVVFFFLFVLPFLLSFIDQVICLVDLIVTAVIYRIPVHLGSVFGLSIHSFVLFVSHCAAVLATENAGCV